MPWLTVIVLALHVLSSVFWAGTTFVLARNGGTDAARLVGPQIGAALVATVTGASLWNLTHVGGVGTSEKVLIAGIGAALTALLVQAIGAFRVLQAASSAEAVAGLTVAVVYRLSAALLIVTVICMAVARYA